MMEGLSFFCERWNNRPAKSVARRLEPIIGRSVLLATTDGSERCIMTVFPERVEVSPDDGKQAHTELVMNQRDWGKVFDGSWSLIGVVFAGRCPYPKHQRYMIAKLSLIFQLTVTAEVLA